MASFLGFLSATLLFILIVNIIIRKSVRKYKLKTNLLVNINNKITKYHKFLGFSVLFFGFIHGYMVFGGKIVIHTGSILLFSVLIMLLLFLAGRYLHYKAWFINHKNIFYIVLVALFLHIFFKNIIYVAL